MTNRNELKIKNTSIMGSCYDLGNILVVIPFIQVNMKFLRKLLLESAKKFRIMK